MSSVIELFSTCYEHLKRHGIKVEFILAETINTPEGGVCTGYFDDIERSLRVATRNADWFFTFAHEYCHFLQHINSQWIDPESVEANTQFEKWLNGQIELPHAQICEITKIIQECELDCEKKTVQLLNDHQIAYSELEYIQLANRYVLSYEISRLYRKEMRLTSVPEVDAIIGYGFIQDVQFIPPGLLNYVEPA